MTAAQKSSTSKRERSIPVKVTIDPRPAPTVHPPLSPIEIAPKQPPVSGQKIQARPRPKKFRNLQQPVHEWPEAKRRRLMWWLVGSGTAVVIIGWLAVVRFELRGGEGPNLFSETLRLLKTVRWPGTEAPQSPQEQEIRDLDNQVFPELTQ